MSRIDEALKVLERDAAGARGVTPADTASSSAPVAPLTVYPGESRTTSDAPAAQDRSAHRPHARRVENATVTPRPRLADPESKLIGRATAPVLVEQYRRLAASLHEAQGRRGLNTVMMTSAVPREGKTLTTLNLALTLSESYDRRVLVVDADLRWPSIHDVLGIPNTRGLCEALDEPGTDVPLIEWSQNLSVLTAGHAGSSPLAGLTSDRMAVLLDEFERRFDWVLIDTPPVGFLPDAQLLARLIEAVVFVIGAGSTPARVVERAVAALGSECILGVVLNRVEENQIQDAGYYYGGSNVPPVQVR